MGGGHIEIARAALAGGAAIIQLRDKSSSIRALLPVARVLRTMAREAGALFLVNDRIDLALAVEADGVHLGPDDMPLPEARRLLGPHRLLGASCGDVQEARAAYRAGADYIGAGAVFGTATKSDAGAAIGLDALRTMVDATPLPVAAVGGINASNVASVIAAGACMACVVSAVALAGSPQEMVAATHGLIETAGF